MNETACGSLLRPAFTPEQIAAAVRRIAGQLNADYAGRELHLLVVLKGAYLFAADLSRHLDLAVTLDFIRIASYRGTASSGSVSRLLPPGTELRDREVLVVEDILDTGLSLRYLMESLAAERPRSLRSCVLVSKRGSRTVPIEADYHGLSWEGGFLVGYGLDSNEQLRNLAGIYEVAGTAGSGERDDHPM